MEKLKLAPYFRVSGSAQADAETIQRQIDNFSERKDKLNEKFDIVYRFEDTKHYFIDEPYNLEEWDESTAFYDLIDHIKRNEVHAVWVSETDRLFRSRAREMTGKILDTFENYNTRIITKNGEVPLGVFLDFTSAVDVDDKKRIMKKLQEGKQTRTKNEGRPVNGKIPFGFTYDYRASSWSLVPDEVKIIKSALGLSIGKVFQEMPDEIKSIVMKNPDGLHDKQVAQVLTSVGFTKESYFKRTNFIRHAKAMRPEFTGASVENTFRKDRYRGVIEYRLKEPHQVGHPLYKKMKREDKKPTLVKVPRIIDDVDWELFLKKRQSRRKLSKKNLKHEYLCKDLLICAECGVPLSARPKDSSKTSKKTGITTEYPTILYYTCARKVKISGFRCAASKCHPVEVIDSLVWDQAKRILLEPTLLSKIQESVRKFQPSTVQQLNKQIQSTNIRLENLKHEKTRAVKFLISGTLTEEDYSNLVAENKIQEFELNHAVEKLKAEVLERIQLQNSTANLDQIVTKFASRADELNFEQRREVVVALINSVEIMLDGQMNVFFKSIESKHSL